MTKEDSKMMKGIAILSIAIHNLLHWDALKFVQENESTFIIDRVRDFNDSIFNLSPLLLGNLFSFLGFYGVPIFCFLSGYGIQKKMEIQQDDESKDLFQFLKTTIIKFVWLLYPAYFLFIVIRIILGQNIGSWFSILTQLTFTNVYFYDSKLIIPGVYWYFAFTIQLYLIYRLFFYKRDNFNILIAAIISILIQVVIIYHVGLSGNQDLLKWIRHNFIGWLPVFCLGVFCARKKIRIPETSTLIEIFLFFLTNCILFGCLQNGYSWLITPIVAVIAYYYFVKLFARISIAKRAMIYLGDLSSYIFVIHPVVRIFFYAILIKTTNVWFRYIETITYVAVCILAALLYNKLIKRVQLYLIGSQK